MMPIAKVLDGASPVNAGHQPVVAEADPLDHCRRTEEEDLVESGLRAKLVDAVKHERTRGQRQDQQGTGDDRGFLTVLHFYFKSRCSKTSTAPLRAMVA